MSARAFKEWIAGGSCLVGASRRREVKKSRFCEVFHFCELLRGASKTARAAVLPALLCVGGLCPVDAGVVVLAWGDSGLREIDAGDCSVYALAPPFSTIHAQVVNNGLLASSGAGFTVTYEAVADAQGSINTTSRGKGNFYENALALYGANLAPDEGLAGFSMPGMSNAPQAMRFDTNLLAWSAVGIPITPIDDAGATNTLPLMKLVARTGSGAVAASTEIALPVSFAMDCRGCHASGSVALARPMSGWVWDCDPVRDYKLNILRYHDDAYQGSALFSASLAGAGYNADGLYATAESDGKPVLCWRCHGSNSWPGSGAAGIRPLTVVMHTKHSDSPDPLSGFTLDAIGSSAACLRCHAGPEAGYLRGAHRNSLDSSGTRSLQCQNCHGGLGVVGSSARQGWLDLPSCQNCHTGVDGHNNGQMVYTSVFDTNGVFRQAIDATFATQTNSPASGFSLFKNSKGHGKLQCAVCHGPAHAEIASSAANDNRQTALLGGQAGSQLDCAVCHPNSSSTASGGPHGLHPVGQTWIDGHGDSSRSGLSACRGCHGATPVNGSLDRGTLLSGALASRALSAGRGGTGVTNVWPGFTIGCYNCHNGPNGGDDGGGGSVALSGPVASKVAVSTRADQTASVALSATPVAGRPVVSYRVITQPSQGAVSVTNGVATYYPNPGAGGADSFIYMASDGYNDSNPAQGAVQVLPAPAVLFSMPAVASAAFPGASVSFEAGTIITQGTGGLSYDWDFGDGSPHSTLARVCHSYPGGGDFNWALSVRGGGASFSTNGVVTISPTLGPPVYLTLAPTPWFSVIVSWPADHIGTSLETSYDLGSPFNWATLPGDPVLSGGVFSVEAIQVDNQFFRIRRVP
jgi:hypothetical protein